MIDDTNVYKNMLTKSANQFKYRIKSVKCG